MSTPANHHEIPASSAGAPLPALADWPAAARQTTDQEPWRVEFHPDATIIHLNVGVSQGDAVDVFIDERGVFVLARETGSSSEARRFAIPLPGALDAERPWTQLREGALTITLPRPEREQRRVPVAVRRSPDEPNHSPSPCAEDTLHA